MRVSVVVCTHNRAHAIIPCLNSIVEALSNAAPIDAEIVVVDNASSDNTQQVVRDWSKSNTFTLQVLFEPRKGLAIARNCGIRAARGELIIFTDDDCRLAPNYITRMLEHDAKDIEPVFRGGGVELGDPTDLPITVNTKTAPGRWNRKMRSARRSDLSHTLLGCNMSARRSTLERIGFFDEIFSVGNIPSGEDTDYIYRAYLAGVTIEYAPDVIVFHHHGRKTVAQASKLYRGYAIGAGALYAKYLFKDTDIVRPAYWNLKHALKEFFVGENDFMKMIGFSHRQLVFYGALGAFRYYCRVLKKRA